MASAIYNTEMMLKKKQLLLRKIEETYEFQELANLEKETFSHMFLTMRDQRTFDLAKINEINPYFDFQNKIYLVLDRIKQTNELRVKLQEHKIKQCK